MFEQVKQCEPSVENLRDKLEGVFELVREANSQALRIEGVLFSELVRPCDDKAIPVAPSVDSQLFMLRNELAELCSVLKHIGGRL